MHEDKSKSIKILETKLSSLQRNIKTLKTESDALIAAQKGNKRYRKLKDLETDLQTQDYIISVFKKFINDPTTYKQVLKRILSTSSQLTAYKSKEELQIELNELTSQLKGMKADLCKIQGLDKSRHEIAVDNISLNFKKAKQAPSVISIQIGDDDFDINSRGGHYDGQRPDLVTKIIKNVKTYRSLLNREYEAINIKYDQNKDKILQARSVLVNIQVIKSKIDETKGQLIEMDSKNNKFEAMLGNYTEGSNMNIETLNNRLKELKKLKNDILNENQSLENEIDHRQLDEDEVLHKETKQQLIAESQDLKIKMLSLKEKLMALDEFIDESDKEIEKKNQKLEQLYNSKTDVKLLYEKKRTDNEARQLKEVEHLKTQKMKRENLMVKMRMVKNEEFKHLTLLENNKITHDEKYQELTALKLLSRDNTPMDRQYNINVDKDINNLVWQKTKLEEQILKKELYLKHRDELLDISSFNSEKDLPIN